MLREEPTCRAAQCKSFAEILNKALNDPKIYKHTLVPQALVNQLTNNIDKLKTAVHEDHEKNGKAPRMFAAESRLETALTACLEMLRTATVAAAPPADSMTETAAGIEFNRPTAI